MAAGALVGLAVALVYLAMATPKHRCTSRLYVERSGPRFLTTQQGLMTQSRNYLFTQAELLRSVPILSSTVEDPSVKEMVSGGAIENPLGCLRGSLNVELSRKDDIISVSLDSARPETAAVLVNAVVRSYMAYHKERKRNTSFEVVRILRKEKDKRADELAGKYREMAEFDRANGMLSLESDQGNVVIQRLSQLSSALTKAQLEVVEAMAIYESTNKLMAEPSQLKQFAVTHKQGVYPSFVSEEDKLRRDLDDGQAELARLLQQATSDHPAVQSAQLKVARLQQELTAHDARFAHAYRTSVIQRWAACTEQEMQIAKSLEQQQEEALNLNAQAAERAVMEAEVKRIEQLCDNLDNRIKEINVTEDAGALNITVLEEAKAGESAQLGHRNRTLLLAMAMGLIFGFVFGLVWDWRDDSLRNAGEIAEILQSPVLGVVPTMGGKKRVWHRRQKDSVRRHGQKVQLESSSPAAEAYRTIRTSLHFSVGSEGGRVLLITSPESGDGKSTFVSNMGVALAHGGERTLIIDADLRKPVQHTIFGVGRKAGLSRVLQGTNRPQNMIQSTAVRGLDLLTSGPKVYDSADLLSGPRLAQLLADVTLLYDRVLVDAPPVLPVADARILGGSCESTLLVVRARKTSRESSEEARLALLGVGAKLLGVVVNDVSRNERLYAYCGATVHQAREPRHDNDDRVKAQLLAEEENWVPKQVPLAEADAETGTEPKAVPVASVAPTSRRSSVGSASDHGKRSGLV